MESRPRIEATSVSLSTPHPRRLARFYAELLGTEVGVVEGPREGEPPEAGWAQLRPVEGSPRMTVNLEWDPDFVRPVWPSTPGEQQPQAHLDLAVDDLDAAEAWALAHLDEDWNIELWGDDEDAAARRTSRFADMHAAALLLAGSD